VRKHIVLSLRERDRTQIGKSMSQRKIVSAMFCLIISTVPSFGQRGDRGTTPATPKPENAQSRAHVEAALKIAGNDSFLMNPYNFFCIPGGARANNVNAPEMEPVKIFDNLYAVGNSEATVYALTTTDGILLIDSGFADRVESVVVPGLKKLGLDPAKVSCRRLLRR
jgi:hypothetical protein